MLAKHIWACLLSAGLLTALGCSAGCARVEIRKERIAKVGSLAIVGFEGQLLLNLKQKPKGKKKPVIRTSMTLPADQLEALATWSYDALIETLQGKFGWKVVTRAELQASPAYQRQHELWMRAGIKAPRTPGTFVTIPGITWTRKMILCPASDFAEMATELGVDAVVVVSLSWLYQRDKPADDGTMVHHPYGAVYIDMTEAGRAETIWLDNTVAGQPVSGQQVFRAGEVHGDDLSVMLRKAMLAGYQNLLEHYDNPPKE